MKQERENNYDKVKELWRKKFLEMDHDALIRRFHLMQDDNALYLKYFSRVYRIDRMTGIITENAFPERELSFNTIIGIYNMFHYAKEEPQASGKLVPFREVKRVYPFESAYKKTVLDELARIFTGHTADLKHACENMHGICMKQGDVGYEIPVLPDLGLKIAVLFWDADEEFPAQANMLFDSEITDFMHEENVVGIASDVLYFLTVEAEYDATVAYG